MSLHSVKLDGKSGSAPALAASSCSTEVLGKHMNFVLLGAGKTGSVVAGVAQEHGHKVRIIEIDENQNGLALNRDSLAGADAVLDFTSPQAVLKNIECCTAAGANMVVGTTGWYDRMGEVRQWVERAGTGFVFGSNFSVGVNVFFKAIAAASVALKHGYSGDILERHHIHKKDAPSGTAVTMQQIIERASGKKVNIRSEREGEVFGFHQLTLTSPADRIVLSHDANSRRGFAEGAVLAAQWISGKKGFYEFREIFDQL